jgi:DNA repair exonuclease SbcCD ATPase subunit
MNCVALSIYLALTKVLPNGFGFVMLDDPSQSLDHEHKEALVDILSEISSERQVVVATQDTELVSLIELKLPTCMKYHFVNWNDSGPEIK